MTQESVRNTRPLERRVSLAQRAMAALGLHPPVVDLPPQGYILHDVTVVNPCMDRKAGQSVKVIGSTITEISDFEAGNPKIEGDNRYAGAYVLPGLMEMHFHAQLMPYSWVPATWSISEGSSLLFLRYGVTTLRDVGNFEPIWETQERFDREDFPCPRLFSCGRLLDGEGTKIGALAQVIRTPAEARAAIKERADRGARYIKVYDWLTPEAMKALRDAAKERGMQIVGQIPFSTSLETSGVEDVQHLNGIQFKEMPLGFNYHDPKDFAMYYKTWAEIDEERIEDIVRIALEKDITFTPTIMTQDRIARLNDPDRRTFDESAYYLPRLYRDILWNPDCGIVYLQGHSDAVYADLKEAIVQIRRVVGRLHEAGVRVLPGTDAQANPFTTPGVSLYEELDHFVLSGFSPEEALLAGTRQSGEWLGVPLLGTLQKNAPADMVVFREDPTRDLAALSTLEAVAVNGRLYTKEFMDEGLNRHKKYYESKIFDSVTMYLAKKIFDENLT